MADLFPGHLGMAKSSAWDLPIQAAETAHRRWLLVRPARYARRLENAAQDRDGAAADESSTFGRQDRTGRASLLNKNHQHARTVIVMVVGIPGLGG